MFGRSIIGLAAAALIAYCVGLVVFADRFPAPGQQASHDWILLFVVATVAVSALHVAACVAAHHRPPRLRHILIVAGAVRILLLFGAPSPILEGDPARARFDARLVNQGLNPYEFKPQYMQDEEPGDMVLSGPQIERLTQARAALSASSDAPRPDQVARPDLRTNATPLATWIGALGDRFKPQSTRGIAYLVLVADSLAVFFLILALRSLCLPVGWVIVYAWSPVLLKEAYCTLSIDAFVMPALAFLLWCLASGRRLLAAVPLALCGGLRFALLALFPALFRRVGLLGAMLAVVLWLVPFVPFQTPDVPVRSYAEGNLHIWRHYEYNSMLENLLRGSFKGLESKAENTLTIGGVTMVEPGDSLDVFLAKIVGLLVLAAVVVYIVIRGGYGADVPGREETEAITDVFAVLAALLIVSPVLHPWLAIWLLPVLAIRPMGLAWLSLPTLVCLSYLTHLRGPQEADLTFLGDEFSFRLLEYGIFGVLVLVDLLFRKTIFSRADEGAPLLRQGAGDEEIALGDLDPQTADVLTY